MLGPTGGFQENDRHQVPDIGKYASSSKEPRPIMSGILRKRSLFDLDAGYDNGELANILAILREKSEGDILLNGRL